jgi:hypothetical protein
MKNFLIISFKIFVFLIITTNVLLRLSSEHHFKLPNEEMLGYAAMIISVILVSILPVVNKNWQKPIKYITIIFLLIVIASGVSLFMATIAVKYESWLVGAIFYVWDLAFISITGYVLHLVLNNHLIKNKPN